MKFTNLIKNLKKISGKSEISLFTNQIEINPHTWDSEDGPDNFIIEQSQPCLLYTSPSPRDQEASRMPSSA